MKNTEKLLFILDYFMPRKTYEDDVKDNSITREAWQKKVYEKIDEIDKKKIDFVHSLGLKCDSVGWTVLDLSRDDAQDLIDKIVEFKKQYNENVKKSYSEFYNSTKNNVIYINKSVYPIFVLTKNLVAEDVGMW